MTRRTAGRAFILLPVVGLLAGACGGGGGDSSGGSASGGSESCYKGETATFVVPYSAGGGYDTIARGMAPFLEDELGATVVVENQEGAGGLTAANNLYTADPDGLTFEIVNTQGILGAVLAGAQGVQYEPDKFTWVGRVSQDTRVLLTGAKSDFKTIDDVLGADGTLKWATAGVGAADHIDANVVPTILGIADKIQVVTGFQGSSETEVAVTAGQVELGSGTLGTRLGGIENGDQRALLIMGRERNDDVPDAPALLELDLGDQQDLAEAYIGLQDGGRAIVAPPEVNQNCLTELQDAFQSVLSDKEFLDKIGGSVDVDLEYTSGDELKTIVDQVLDAPPALVDLLKKAYAE